MRAVDVEEDLVPGAEERRRVPPRPHLDALRRRWDGSLERLMLRLRLMFRLRLRLGGTGEGLKGEVERERFRKSGIWTKFC